MPRDKKKVLIIGAGPAGLSCAHELLRTSEFEVVILEADSSVGGMAKSIKLWDQIVDLGPHRFFSLNPKVNNFFDEIITDEFDPVKRQTRILYNKKFFYYPLRVWNVLYQLGLKEAFLCIQSFLIAQLKTGPDPKNFGEWVTRQFGSRLYKMFFKSYSEKLWGIKCEDLGIEFAAQRIKNLNLWNVVKNALNPIRKGQIRTLVDEFRYPWLGAGELYSKMAKAVQSRGGKIYLNTRVSQIILNQKQISNVKTSAGEEFECDLVVSTMPLTFLVKSLPNIPNEVFIATDNLKFRNTVLVYLLLEGNHYFKDQWVYIHSPEVLSGRVTNFRNWSPTTYGSSKDTILSFEYWCYEGEELWSHSDSKLKEIAEKDLLQSGLGPNAKILNFYVHRVPRCYPVYANNYKADLEIIKGYLSQWQNLQIIGRGGAFKYNNQDHSILMGLLAAENLKGSRHNLWEINSDLEYQEGAHRGKSIGK